jgi:hypothetical protein
MLSWRNRFAGVVVVGTLVAAATAAAQRVDLPGPAVSSRAAKAGCAAWTGQAVAKHLPVSGRPRCAVEWSWLDDGHRLSRARYAWHDESEGYLLASLEVLFEELGEDRAWGIAGVMAPDTGRVDQFSSLRIGGRLIVRGAECANGPKICNDFTWEWTPGGTLTPVESWIEGDVSQLLGPGYDDLQCEPVKEQYQTVKCSACPSGGISSCCPETTIYARVVYEDFAFRVKKISKDVGEGRCEVRQLDPR